MPSNRFSSDNQPPAEKKKRGKDHRTLMLEALGRNGVSEEVFWDRVVLMAMKDGSEHQRAMMQEIMNRMAPQARATLPMVNFEWGEAVTPADKIDRLVELVSLAEISPDVAHMLANTIRAGLEVREITELVERLEKLEALLAQQDRGL